MIKNTLSFDTFDLSQTTIKRLLTEAAINLRNVSVNRVTGAYHKTGKWKEISYKNARKKQDEINSQERVIYC